MVGNEVSFANGYRVYRFENGSISYPSWEGDYIYVYRLNNAGLAYGYDWDTEKTYWFDNSSVHEINFNSFSLNITGLSDAGLMAIEANGSTYLHPLLSNDFLSLATPAGFSDPFNVSVSHGGLIHGNITALIDSSNRIGFWTADGSFDHFFSPTTGLTNLRFND